MCQTLSSKNLNIPQSSRIRFSAMLIGRTPHPHPSTRSASGDTVHPPSRSACFTLQHSITECACRCHLYSPNTLDLGNSKASCYVHSQKQDRKNRELHRSTSRMLKILHLRFCYSSFPPEQKAIEEHVSSQVVTTGGKNITSKVRMHDA